MWFVKNRKKTKSRFGFLTVRGRRVTGMVTEMPTSLRHALIALAGVVALSLIAWWGWSSLKRYYNDPNGLFILRDTQEDIMIYSGKTLTPELIKEVLQLRSGINIFSLDIAEKRKELLERTPNIRNMSIVRHLPNKLTITIFERDPIIRIGPHGRVADEEGVVFIRYAGIGGLPMLKGGAECEQLKPGDRLDGNQLAAVKLVVNAMRPECRLRMLALDASKEDYLLLTFDDYRQAKFAWPGMGDYDRHSPLDMQRQFDHLAMVMEQDIGRPRMMWDATQPDRIFAMSLGTQ